MFLKSLKSTPERGQNLESVRSRPFENQGCVRGIQIQANLPNRNQRHVTHPSLNSSGAAGLFTLFPSRDGIILDLIHISNI